MPDEAMTDLIGRMREANTSAKTARARTKTAAPEDLGRGDLLSRTISDITAAEEERIFPEEVKSRKEAAEREESAKTAGKTASAQPSATGAPAQPQLAAASATAQASSQQQQAKTAAADDDLPFDNVAEFLGNPLVKHGFDSVMRENHDEIRWLSAIIMTR